RRRSRRSGSPMTSSRSTSPPMTSLPARATSSSKPSGCCGCRVGPTPTNLRGNAVSQTDGQSLRLPSPPTPISEENDLYPMIVSHHWLSEYVDGELPLEELTHRLTMSGLNLEGTEPVGDDVAIDLEVTSNRPDCLGHIGVAREAAVLFGLEHRIPDATVQTVKEKTADATSVAIECPDLCPQYIARVIKGVKVGPSPDWLQQRLRTLGITPINNIVDVTNYVLMECGQPLHTF